MKTFVAFVLTSILATSVLAHSKVETTVPQDGATLAKAPAEVSLGFAKDIRLTRVEMIRQDQPAVQMDLGDQTSFERAFTLPFDVMGKGTYRIEWRGLGVDGHTMQGKFSFTVE